MSTPPDADPSEEPGGHVGTCPDCGTPLPRSNVVIEYETGEEWGQLAVCTECRDLVHA
ncbi:DUF7837 family putative zinc-binding protein [Halosimplex salinum]|uniref:DUF7837 family putative zinc-binding protein n=1 Tax=Halosimplex salinum TaxID=1710538 RepID=UPI0013DE55D1|nr:hypothetical protein [Halosimplex salinum]